MSLDRNRDHTLDKDAGIDSSEIDDNAVTDAKIASHTTTKITLPTTRLSGTVTNDQLAGSIALSKLLTPPEPNSTADQTGSEIKALYELEANAFTDTKNTKLAGIATGATANDTDANLRARSSHTGDQTASTISDFASAVGSSTSTFTNKTFDANGTGNSVSNIDDADINLTDGNILVGTVTTNKATQRAMSGDITISNTGATTIGALKVTDGMLAGTISNSKLATNPLARANHTGTQTASTVSDFDTQVRLSRIDQMAVPTATVDVNTQILDNVQEICTGLISDETNTVAVLTITDTTGDTQLEQHLTIADAKNIILNSTTGTKIGTATTQKLAFFGDTPVVQPTALTTPETTLTFVNENTPDFALSSLTTTTPAGFATLDEAQAFVEVVVNLQARVNELESKLQALGLLA